jgi:Transaldolase/Fructose-6-phosphate aldolase
MRRTLTHTVLLCWSCCFVAWPSGRLFRPWWLTSYDAPQKNGQHGTQFSSNIGPHTINTIPPATLKAFRDHGRVQPTLEAGEQDAERALRSLAKLGIDLGAISEKLLADGITAFTHSLDELLASLKEKRRGLLESPAARKSGIRPARIV